MATPFSTLLAKAREAAGFRSPHDFYKKSGGKRVLGMSFVNYWRLERGETLPKPDRLSLLVSCLRLPHAVPKSRELLRAYLLTLLGSERTYEWMRAALAPERPDLSRQAVRRVMEQANYPLSLDQFRAIIRNYPAYWSFVLLCNDRRSWRTADLARKLGAGPRKLAASLKSLARHKLISIGRDGRVSCPFAGKAARLPRPDMASEQDRQRVREYQRRMLKSQGTLLWHVYLLPRAYEPELETYFPHLSQAVGDSHVYALSGEPGEEKPGPTSLFLVEGAVHRLFSF